MLFNHYAVCLIEWKIRGQTHCVYDVYNFPNPNKDPKGVEKVKERAEVLRSMFGAISNEALKEAAQIYRQGMGIPTNVRLRVRPVLLRELEGV